MATFFYRNPLIVALIIVVLCAFFMSSYVKIARQEDPSITNIFALILTPYPGANPERVEALVTEKIENELRELPEIRIIQSTSRTGISAVSIELQEEIAKDKIESVWSEVRDAVDDAARNFPEGVLEPRFDNDRLGAFSAIITLSFREGYEHNETLLRRYSEALQDRLRTVTDTSVVEVFGARDEEILVSIESSKLFALGLSFAQVSQAIRQSDSKVRSGQLRGSTKDYLIEVSGELEQLNSIRRIPLSTNADGTTVQIGDIATVERVYQSPPSSISITNGESSVLVAARMENDRQIDTWSDAIKAEVASFAKTLPQGIEVTQIFDQNQYTTKRFGELAMNLIVGALIVAGILVFSLGWRSGLIVCVNLPLAAMFSIGVMNTMGIPIHQMSVIGLIVALGLLVDAAIVMTNEIRSRLLAGIPRIEAVRISIERLTVPLLASTLTTISAFLPMVLLPGPAGDFIGSIATCVIIMLIASLMLALVVTPAFCGWYLSSDPDVKIVESDDASMATLRAGLQNGIVLPRISHFFDQTLRYSLANKGVSVLAAISIPLIGLAAFPTLTAQFFPGNERDQMYVQVRLPEGTSIERTQRVTKEVDQILRSKDTIKHIQWVIGENAPPFYYNLLRNQDGVPYFSEALITTTSDQATVDLLAPLQKEMDEKFPEAEVLVRYLVQGPPVNAPVEIRLVGPGLETLRAKGEELRAIMSRVPEITHHRADMEGGPPKLLFALDEAKVRLAGLDLVSVAQQLDFTLEGITGGSIVEGSEELPVRMRVDQSEREDLSDIRSLSVLGPQTAQLIQQERYAGIPLASLGELKLVPSEGKILRRNGERINNIQGFVPRDILPEEALKKVQREMARDNFTLPEGYRIEYGGDSDARNRVIVNLAASASLVVTLAVVVIVLTFNSFMFSAISGVVCVLSFGLSLFTLAVFNFPFGIQAIIGSIGAIGVSINAAIIIITALQADPECLKGNIDRIREVVMHSSRHILSTTITTVGGFMPLILEGGDFWPPFAIAIAGAVFLSAIVSFYFTPPMFLAVVNRGKKA